MPNPPSSLARNVRPRNFSTWRLSLGFAILAVMLAAQTSSPGQNLNSNAPVAVPPDAQAQPQPAVKSQPSGERWADYFRIQKVSQDDDWTRHFRIGAMVGMNISASFSMNGQFTIPGNNAANGIFDDGYVQTDNTGNAFGQTGNWGYNWGNNNATAANPSQYNAANQTLMMHSTTAYAASSDSESGGSVFPGFDMAYGGNLFYLGRARIGWDLGFGFLPISITDNSTMSATVSQSTFVFNTGGIVVPDATYQGGFNRQGEPTLSSVSSTNWSSSTQGTVTSSHSLDVMLYTVRLGPSVYWDLNESFGLSASFGPAIGIVSGDYKYNEIVTAGGVSANNSGKFGATDLVYGGYVNATVMYHVPNENADIYLGAQFMPLGDATFSGGGREAQLKLGGQVNISAGINWSF
jgi:hypothetical protein